MRKVVLRMLGMMFVVLCVSLGIGLSKDAQAAVTSTWDVGTNVVLEYDSEDKTMTFKPIDASAVSIIDRDKMAAVELKSGDYANWWNSIGPDSDATQFLRVKMEGFSQKLQMPADSSALFEKLAKQLYDKEKVFLRTTYSGATYELKIAFRVLIALDFKNDISYDGSAGGSLSHTFAYCAFTADSAASMHFGTVTDASGAFQYSSNLYENLVFGTYDNVLLSTSKASGIFKGAKIGGSNVSIEASTDANFSSAFQDSEYNHVGIVENSYHCIKNGSYLAANSKGTEFEFTDVNLENLENGSHMFENAALNRPIWLEGGESSVHYLRMPNLTDASYMFAGIDSYSNLVNNWCSDGFIRILTFMHADNIVNAEGMFKNTILQFNGSRVNYWPARDYAPEIERMNTSHVTNMKEMFCGAALGMDSFDLTSWDFTNVTTASDMFKDFSGGVSNGINTSIHFNGYPHPSVDDRLRQPLGELKLNGVNMPVLISLSFKGAIISKISASGVNAPLLSNFDYVFSEIVSDTVDVSNWTVAATSMTGMFKDADVKTKIKMSDWSDTSGLTKMDYAFYNVYGKDWRGNENGNPEIDLSNLDTSAVTDMSHTFEKSRASSYKIDSFVMDAVTDVSYMFSESDVTSDDFNSMSSVSTNACQNFSHFLNQCSKLEHPDISRFIFTATDKMDYFMANSGIKSVAVPSVQQDSLAGTTLSHAFFSCTYLESIDLTFLNPANISYLDYLFEYDTSLAEVVGFDGTAFPTLREICHAFSFCEALPALGNLDGWTTTAITDASYVFNRCEKLDGVSANWDLSNVTNISHMFNRCQKLSDYSASILNGLSNKLTVADYAWSDCDNFSADFANGISGLPITAIINAQYLLAGNDSITNLDWTGKGFTKASVDGMLMDCSNLGTFKMTGETELRSMYGMMMNCVKLKVLDMSSWKLVNMQGFPGNIISGYGDGLEYRSNATGGINKAIDGCDGLYEIRLPENWDNSPAINSSDTSYYLVTPVEKDNMHWYFTDTRSRFFSNTISYVYAGKVLKLGFDFRIKGNEKASAISSGVSESQGIIYYDQGTIHTPTLQYKKTGYTFLFYDADKDAAEGSANADAADTDLNWQVDDVEDGVYALYCIWKPISYTIHFNANGGTGTMPDQSVEYDTEDKIDKCTYTKDGYKFKGWSYKPNGYVQLMDERKVKNFRNKPDTVDLYAIWGPNQSTLNIYDRDKNLAAKAWVDTGVSLDDYKYLVFDDDVVSITKFAIYDSGYDTNVDLGDAKYTFKGWKYLDDDTAVDFSAPVTGDTDIYVSEQPNKYKLNLYKEEGATPIVKTYTYGVGKVLPNVSKVGYDFDGWYEDVDDSTTRKDSITTTDFGTFNLYAKMAPQEYSINYDYDGGTLASGESNPTSYKTVSDSFTLYNPSKTGYVFRGWRDDNNPMAAPVLNVQILKGMTGDRSYSAVFEAIDYDLLYDYGNNTFGDVGALESGSTNPSTYNVETPTFTLNEPKLRGYRFKEWKDASDSVVSGTITQGTMGDKTFKATYDLENYSITVDAGAGTMSALPPATYTIESDDITLVTPTYVGHNFSGWVDEHGTPVSNVIPKGSSGNRVFQAVYDVIPYSITYDYGHNSIGDVGALGAGKTNPASYNVETATFTLNEPSLRGYTFKEWRDASNAVVEGKVVSGSTGNKVFNAKYDPKAYSITVDTCGGTMPILPPTSYTIETGDIVLSTPTKTGYVFNRWTDESGNTVSGSIPQGSVGNKTFKAVYRVVDYDISYDYGRNSSGDVGALPTGLVNPTAYNVESDDFTLYEPELRGYTFKEWHDGSDSVVPGVVTRGSTGDKQFKSIYRPTVYSILTDPGMGTMSVVPPTSYTFESDDITIVSPALVGHTFSGWKDENGVSVSNKIPKGSVGNREFHAAYDLVTYPITYENLNGGYLPDGKLNPDWYTSDDATFTLHNPVRVGWRFTGWEERGTGITTTEAKVYHGSTGAKVFRAHWEKITYRIRYDYDGGALESGKTNPETYTVSDPDIKLNRPVKRGYRFVKWVDETGAVQDEVIDTSLAKDRFYKAVYEAIEYDLKIDSDGGYYEDGFVPPLSYTVEDELTIPNPKKAGYTFTGWNDESNSPVEGKIEKGTIGDLYFGAQYDLNRYSITYDYAGGTLEDGKSNPDSYTVEDADFTLNEPSKRGYRFVQWVDETGNVVGGTVKTNLVKNRYFKAVFKAIDYTVTVNIKGGRFDGYTPPATYTVEDEFELAVPKKTGYDFSVWKDASNATVSNKVERGSIGNRVFNAVYTPTKFKITYDYTGGALPDGKVNPETYTVDDANFKLYTPVKNGYEFSKWTDSDGNALSGEVNTSQAKDLVYVAVYKPKSYRISIETNGGRLPDGVTVPASYTIEDEVTIPDPFKRGYDFNTWVSATGTAVSGKIWKGTTGNLVFDADYSVIHYDLSVDENGGKFTDGYEPPKTYTVEDEVVIKDPEKRGYDLDHWEDNDGDIVPNKIEKGTIGKQVLIAQYAPTDYSITIDLNGGKFENGYEPPKTYTVEDSVVIEDPSKDGYEFVTWRSATGGAVTGKIEKGSIGDLVFKAEYKETPKDPEVFSVTVDTNGGSFPEGYRPPSRYTENDEFALETPVKKGYKFSTWRDASGKAVSGKVKKGTKGDLVFKADYDLIDYQIVVDTNGGRFPDGYRVPSTYTIEDEIVIKDPSKRGYDFSTWRSATGSAIASKIERGTTGNLVFKADYDLKDYKITVNTNGGNFPNGYEPPKTYTIEDSVIIKDPEKKGYDFDKWVDDGGKEVPNKIEKGSTGDLVFKADYDVIHYDLNVDPNGGKFDDGHEPPKTYTVEDEVIIDDPSKKGYDFKSWIGASGSAITGKIEKGTTGDLVFKADYDVINYDLTIDTNGGSFDNYDPPKTYTVEDEVIIPDPSKRGYDFKSWTSDDGTPNDGVIRKGSTGDVVFRATYDVIHYKITVNPNGGEFPPGTNVPTNYTIEKRTEIPKPEWPGHTFTGWVDENGNPVNPIIPEGETGERVYTGTWTASERIVHNINYELNGGELPEPYPRSFFEDEEMPIPNCSKKGYDFLGWTVNGAGDSVVDYVIPKGTKSDVNLFANFDAIQYKIKYQLNGGKFSAKAKKNNLTVYTVEDSFKVINPKRKGYDFGGWDVQWNGKTDSVWEFSLKKGSQGDIVLKAIWNKVKVPDTYVHMYKTINKGSSFKVKLLNTKGCTVHWSQSREGIVSIKGTTMKAIKNGVTNVICTVVKNGYVVYKFGIKVTVQTTRYRTENTSNMTSYGQHGPVVLLDKTVFLGSPTRIKYKKIGNAKITYKIKNKKIVTVDKNGVVRGHKSGFTYGVATVKKGGKITHYVFHFKVSKPLK